MAKQLLVVHAVATLLLLLSSIAPALSLSAVKEAAVPPPGPRVAIIGGGIAGASTAYFLRDLFANSTSFGLDVYTDESTVGGRLALASLEGREFESGGAIIHDRNLYMRHFAEQVLGLSVMYHDDETRLAVFNGKEAVLDTSDWYLVKMAQLLARYGVSAFVRLRRFVSEMLADFGRIYARQNSGQAFTSVEKLLAAMSARFTGMAADSIEKVLLDRGFDAGFINELVAGAMRNNYGQNVTIHGFVGAVSLAGAEGGLWSVRGGNRLVVDGLLGRVSGCEGRCRLLRAARVTRLARDGQGWLVTSSTASGEAASTERYDQVVLTAPGHQRFDIQINPEDARVERVVYHTTVATFVKGELNHTVLGLASRQERYSLLTGTPAAPLDFNSIGYQFDVEGRASDGVYKVFSQRPLSQAQLSRLFSRVDASTEVSWLAYPLYTRQAAAALTNASLVLARGLYHTAPMELAASAMEMSALAGRNAALLAHNDWTGRAADLTDPTGEVPDGAEWVTLRHTEL